MDKALDFLNLSAVVAANRSKKNDDVVDRLNHKYTTFLFALMACVALTRQFVGDKINCWAPAQFTDNYIEYTNQICWVSNTYYLPFHTQQIPDSTRTGSKPRHMINYYQWVPFILVFQAMLFYVPYLLWQFFYKLAGTDVTNLIDACQQLHQLDLDHKDRRTDILKFVQQQFDKYLATTTEHGGSSRFVRFKHSLANIAVFACGRRCGNCLVGLYLCTKLLYTINSLSQIWILNAFLGNNFSVFGWELLNNVYSEENWIGSYRFPRVTLCDFKIRMLARVHTYTVQCVLPINLFLEKVFLFIWFWLTFVAIVTLLNFLLWVCRTITLMPSRKYVKGYLRNCTNDDKVKSQVLRRRFVEEYLRHDGVLLLRLIETNTNRLAATEVIEMLWNNYRINTPNHKYTHNKFGLGDEV